MHDRATDQAQVLVHITELEVFEHLELEVKFVNLPEPSLSLLSV